MSPVSQDNIAKSGGKLRFGARQFIVSHTFVLAQMTAQSVTDPTLIWRGPSVVGLVTQNLLCSIEQYLPEFLGGDIITWTLTCNANEQR